MKGKKLYGDEFSKLKYSKDDPSIYQLSCMEEHPTTDDGFETIGFTLSASDWHWMITLGNPAGFIADGAPDNGQWLIDENNEAMYKFRSEKEREYFNICSDEGQVLTRWGIEGVNYEIDEEGHRYRPQEEIDYANTDKDYDKKTGVGFHGYPFPYYGNGTLDPTGSTYTTTSKESVIAEYDEEQKAACETWGVELLTDIFPQADEFETPMYSPVWAYTMPDEFTQISNQLDEVAWPALVKAIIGSESEFDATYDKMLSDLDNVGVADAEAMLTRVIQDKVDAAE